MNIYQRATLAQIDSWNGNRFTEYISPAHVQQATQALRVALRKELGAKHQRNIDSIISNMDRSSLAHEVEELFSGYVDDDEEVTTMIKAGMNTPEGIPIVMAGHLRKVYAFIDAVIQKKSPEDVHKEDIDAAFKATYTNAQGFIMWNNNYREAKNALEAQKAREHGRSEPQIVFQQKIDRVKENIGNKFIFARMYADI